MTLTLGKQGSVGSVSNVNATPFSNNCFTTVPPSFGAPPSPTRAGFAPGAKVKGRMKGRSQSKGATPGGSSGKRKRDEAVDGGEGEAKKKK
ncbi:hypothetical protein NLJ89_g4076 [Agrocybe chaxingu]|uniref:Uncharacterized protein n=1 Tax=Agrocybe chaxingu TaxID=84603 RepID=A0A9W8K4L7_9AGAR|nr:hypothetical protein NLJ89_g4076 [Agrocybe chaxingu]